MLNFTVGPVQSIDSVRKVGSKQIPYFRTEEFSEMIFENEMLVKKFAMAGENARVVFITGSGTAAMEAAVINTLTSEDKVLIINGGSFGERFVQLCEIYEILYSEIVLEMGKALTKEQLIEYDNCGYTALLVNVNETSTGVHYDMRMIGEFCKKNNMFLIADAISSFLADTFNMVEFGVDIMITGSQKAIACPPGISLLVLSDRAINRVYANHPKCMYFDLEVALKNGDRGQTPFTPAVGILYQINVRLKEIEKAGGAENEMAKIAELAKDFREKILGLPFEIYSESLSNAVTPLCPIGTSAYEIFRVLKDEYKIWVCPNGGELKEKIFRVGHIGALSKDDNTTLILALKDMQRRGLI